RVYNRVLVPKPFHTAPDIKSAKPARVPSVGVACSIEGLACHRPPRESVLTLAIALYTRVATASPIRYFVNMMPTSLARAAHQATTIVAKDERITVYRPIVGLIACRIMSPAMPVGVIAGASSAHKDGYGTGQSVKPTNHRGECSWLASNCRRLCKSCHWR